MTSEERIDVFEKMPVKRAVIKQLTPAIAAQMIAVLYNLADTYFVGMLNAPSQTAAVTIVAPYFILLTGVANLFGIGGASLIARKLGVKCESEARKVSSIAFWCSLFAAVSVSVLFFIFAKPLLRVCGAGESTFLPAYSYARWIIIVGAPFIILGNSTANLVRAEGSAAVASFGTALGGVINIILDPFFVLPQFLNMGVEGAGIATAISGAVSAGYFLIHILRRRKTSVICISPVYLRAIRGYISDILSIGFPSFIQQLLTVVAVAAQAKFVSQYDTEAVAALGIVKKIDQLPLFFSIGVSNGLLPLLAYNHARGDDERRSSAFRFGCSVAVGFSLFCVIVYEIFAPELTSLFIADGKTVSLASSFLRRMVLAMPLMAINFPMIMQFQAMGRAKESIIASVLRKGSLDIPLLFILDSISPLYGCMWVQPIVDSISLVIASFMYYKIKKEAN